MEALSAYMLRRFEDRMTRHIATAFPEKFQEFGEEGTRKLILEGIAKAEGYGIQAERNVALFIDLMVAIGPDFDLNREFSWMQPILCHPERHENIRLNMIYSQMKQKAPHIKLPVTPR